MRPISFLLGAAVLASTLAAPLAHAEGGNSPWYMGFNAGVSLGTFDQNLVSARLAAQGHTGINVQTNDNGQAVKAYGGYIVNRWFAVEAGVFSLRTFEVNASVNGGTYHSETKVAGYNADAVVRWPLTDDLRLLGRLGILAARGKTDAVGQGAVVVATPNQKTVRSGMKMGVGVEYTFFDQLSGRAELERYHVPEGSGDRSDVDAITLGLVWRF